MSVVVEVEREGAFPTCEYDRVVDGDDRVVDGDVVWLTVRMGVQTSE